VTRDILEVGHVWAYDLSALELQNAESKRVFESGGARNLTFRDEGTSHVKGADGEYRLIMTKGYGSSAATSTLKKMLISKTLRVGDGMFSIPVSRTVERLFGEQATGRTKAIKIEWADQMSDYNPAEDSCLDAYIRFIAARATADALKKS
jgi:hypothetical protein